MRKVALIYVTALLVTSYPSQADIMFDAQISLLNDKTEFCNVELDETKTEGPRCKDLQAYLEFMTKGNIRVFMTGSMNNGNINNGNSQSVIDAFTRATNTLRRIVDVQKGSQR